MWLQGVSECNEEGLLFHFGSMRELPQFGADHRLESGLVDNSGLSPMMCARTPLITFSLGIAENRGSNLRN